MRISSLSTPLLNFCWPQPPRLWCGHTSKNCVNCCEGVRLRTKHKKQSCCVEETPSLPPTTMLTTHTCFFFLSALLAVARGTDVTAFFYNETPAPLTLYYYSAVFGSFTTVPPATVAANSNVQWAMTSADYGYVGWIEYDVYFTRYDPISLTPYIYLFCLSFSIK